MEFDARSRVNSLEWLANREAANLMPHCGHIKAAGAPINSIND
jgi:hypothetical protein